MSEMLREGVVPDVAPLAANVFSSSASDRHHGFPQRRNWYRDLEGDDVEAEMTHLRAELKERGNQSALRPDGTLKEASEISWFHNQDDTTPLSILLASMPLLTKDKDEDGQPLPPKSRRKQRPAPQKKQSTKASDTKDTDFVCVDSDETDLPALLTCSDLDDSEDNNNNNNKDEDFFNISPEEIANILPSKSLPDAFVKVNARLRQATVKRKEAKESARNADAAPTSMKRNPVYLLYEESPLNAGGQVGNPGDKHYKCFHGQRKVLTITKAMRSSLNGVTLHLKTHFPAMYPG
ncbi:hypothetical protein HGRIS_014000 [Hohenbuehelia grisea]|uniref:Uncharacterized protein n=1 Tax=Hohenbuehelia grisea TaxID=104357 RepID=A0ABR3JS74_9AGAR